VGQAQAAAALTGPDGWVTILIPAGAQNTSGSQLPPACAGYSSAQAIRAAYALNLSVVARLEPQYGVAWRSNDQCFDPPQGQLRDASDDNSQPLGKRTSFTKAAAWYAQVARSLPLPPDGSDLYVQIGNEFNLAWGCDCDAGGAQQCMSMFQVAAEAASMLRDALAALNEIPRIKVAISPIAPIGRQVNQCCPNATCPGSDDISLTSMDFMRMMLAAVPDLWARVDWLSAHSYPCSQPGCGLSDGTHAPARPCTGWNTPYNESQAWLTSYRNESAVAGVAGKPVIITETGWCRDCCSEQDRADWTVAAFKELWLPDPQVIAVTPFLLAGAQWEKKGFVWMLSNGTKLPVYTAVQQLRAAAATAQFQARH